MNSRLLVGLLALFLMPVSVAAQQSEAATVAAPEFTQRVQAHPVAVQLDVGGDSYSFEATVATGIPGAVTVGHDGQAHAYRVELSTNGEKMTPNNVRFLPLEIVVYREDKNGRLLLNDSSMGLKIGATGTMEIGGGDQPIQIKAAVGEAEEHWVSEAKLESATACFENQDPLFNSNGKRVEPEKASPGENAGTLGSGDCCTVHCGGTWTKCCNVIACCDCMCCYPP